MERLTTFTKSSEQKKKSSNELGNFLVTSTFTDCTLVVDQGEKFQCHRVILSSCSPYFNKVFKCNHETDKHPILVFENLKKDILVYLLQFIYKEEVEVPESQKKDFIAFMKHFGMNEYSTELLEDNTSSDIEIPGSSTVKSERSRSMQQGTKSTNEAQNITCFKKEPLQMLATPGIEDLSTIRRMTLNLLNTSEPASISFNKENVRSKKEKLFQCKFCFKKLGSQRSVKGHEKSCKENPNRQTFACIDCKMEFSRGNTLKNHVRRVHKK